MGRKRETGGEIVLSYLEQYPDWYPANSLSRIIFDENKHTFDSSEQVRCLIRYYQGQMGERNRKQVIKYSDFVRDRKKSTKFAQPETKAIEKKVFELGSGYRRVGFISDLQVPFHDPKAIDLCFDYLHKEKVDCLFINGDLLDFYGISQYVKDPRDRDFLGEYEDCIEMIMYIKQSFDVPIYYNLDANHEARWGRYMAGKAPELLGLKLFSIEDLLRLDEFGIKYIKDIHHIKIGKLPVIHGDTVFRFGSGVFPAKRLFDKVKTSCIASHVHRSSEYTDKSPITDEMSTCWTTGHLMHPNVDYAKHTDQYNQGFAVIYKDASGDYEVHNKRIYKGKVR